MYNPEIIYGKVRNFLVEKLTNQEYMKNQAFPIKTGEQSIIEDKKARIQFLINQYENTQAALKNIPVFNRDKQQVISGSTKKREGSYAEQKGWEELLRKEVQDVIQNYPYVDLTPFASQSSLMAGILGSINYVQPKPIENRIETLQSMEYKLKQMSDTVQYLKKQNANPNQGPEEAEKTAQLVTKLAADLENVYQQNIKLDGKPPVHPKEVVGEHMKLVDRTGLLYSKFIDAGTSALSK